MGLLRYYTLTATTSVRKMISTVDYHTGEYRPIHAA